MGSSGTLCTEFAFCSNELSLKTVTSVGELPQGFSTPPLTQVARDLQKHNCCPEVTEGANSDLQKPHLLACLSDLRLFSKLLVLALCYAVF